MRACDDCLRRTDLVAALAGWLDIEWRRRDAPGRVLARSDEVLLGSCALPGVRPRYERFDPVVAREGISAAGLMAVCRCDDAYPERLLDLPDPPAVLHVAGDLACVGGADSVAIVGARRATSYGLTVARDLGARLSATGVTVVSGLALGVDSAAHAGALEGGAAPVAVLAGGADRPYPASKRQLHAAVRAAGAVVSELPPGFGIHRWAFVARNRLIAALAQVVVVVEATRRSGSLTTADLGAEIGRTVAAVPGRVTCAVASGTNELIRDGAVLVRGVSDVLESLTELTGATYDAQRARGSGLEPDLARLLEAVGAGHSTLPMLANHGFDPRGALAGLGELESAGLIRRGFGGRYERVP
ncbi:MAG TPA: DNA-processing protein DprA [Solirubrobacteraceae bacterium]|nr:DNA-processing protein DprA [Solirubrobacteraceae bacterium]